MIALYLLAAFAVGWAACWKISGAVTRNILRRDLIAKEVLGRLTYDGLERLGEKVQDELVKRRGTR